MLKRLIPPIIVVALIAGCVPAKPNNAVSPLPTLPSATPGTTLYFPMYRHIPTPTPKPTATPVPCLRTPQSAQFAKMLIADARQQRVRLWCHPALAEAARQRAESMAALGYFGHCDPSGVCANTVARAAGCRLPSNYGSGNNIESLIAGTGDPALAWKLLSASPSHALHLLGLNDFFRSQYHYGVAFADVPGSKYSFYWVVLIGICQ